MPLKGPIRDKIERLSLCREDGSTILSLAKECYVRKVLLGKCDLLYDYLSKMETPEHSEVSGVVERFESIIGLLRAKLANRLWDIEDRISEDNFERVFEMVDSVVVEARNLCRRHHRDFVYFEGYRSALFRGGRGNLSMFVDEEISVPGKSVGALVNRLDLVVFVTYCADLVYSCLWRDGKFPLDRVKEEVFEVWDTEKRKFEDRKSRGASDFCSDLVDVIKRISRYVYIEKGWLRSAEKFCGLVAEARARLSGDSRRGSS